MQPQNVLLQIFRRWSNRESFGPRMFRTTYTVLHQHMVAPDLLLPKYREISSTNWMAHLNLRMTI